MIPSSTVTGSLCGHYLRVLQRQTITFHLTVYTAGVKPNIQIIGKQGELRAQIGAETVTELTQISSIWKKYLSFKGSSSEFLKLTLPRRPDGLLLSLPGPFTILRVTPTLQPL